MSRIEVFSSGKLLVNEIQYDCVLGKNGITDDKSEGDMSTPAGEFPLRLLYYRTDKVERPVTNLSIQILCEDDGWCDDPSHTHYNRHVKLPHEGSHENLWRANDDLYDLIIPIGYNDNPAQPGKGSAIFIHVARPDMAPTAGCIALKKDDLIEILRDLGPDSTIKIYL